MAPTLRRRRHAADWSNPNQPKKHTMIKATLPATETVAPFITVLGTNKGKPRSRVWLEGKRLVDAGFGVGTPYARIQTADSITLIAQPLNAAGDWYHVSGKGDKPVLDITGKIITDTFPSSVHVYVTFERVAGFDPDSQRGVAANVITIRCAAAAAQEAAK